VSARLKSGDEAIADAGNRLDVQRSIGGISERVTKLDHGFVEAAVEIDIDVGGPQLLPDFFAGDGLAGALEQDEQEIEGLLLKFDARAFLAEFVGARIDFEDTETEQR
jgi:hypothetical protein